MNLSTIPAIASRSTIHVVVESPRGSTLKLKYDPQLEAMSLSRPLPSGLVYPYDWGFVPSTNAADGDPLDAMVLWDHASFPGMVLPCRLIGMLAVEQNSKQSPSRRERNDRVLVVPVDAPRSSSLQSVSALSVRAKRELEAFFYASTVFERKAVKFLGWYGASAAERLVRASLMTEEK